MRATNLKGLIISFAILLIPLTMVVPSTAEDSSANDITTPLDLLGNHNSAAATILNVSEESISRISTPQDLITSISTATGGFKSFPTLMSLEISPFWLFKGDRISYHDYISSGALNQSTISIATKTDYVNDKRINYVSSGLSLQFFQGEMNSDFLDAQKNMTIEGTRYNNSKQLVTDSLFQEKLRLQAELTALQLKNPEELKTEDINRIENIKGRLIELTDDKIRVEAIRKADVVAASNIKKLADGLNWQRTGFKWDINVAEFVAFNQEKVEESKSVSFFSGWTTFGYEDSYHCYLGVLRVNRDFVDIDNSYADGGVKILIIPNEKVPLADTYEDLQTIKNYESPKLSVSLEAIHKYYYENKKNHEKISISFTLKATKKIKIPLAYGFEFAPNYSKHSVSLNLDSAFGGILDLKN
jgi:hypothetical protein